MFSSCSDGTNYIPMQPHTPENIQIFKVIEELAVYMFRKMYVSL